MRPHSQKTFCLQRWQESQPNIPATLRARFAKKTARQTSVAPIAASDYSMAPLIDRLPLSWADYPGGRRQRPKFQRWSGNTYDDRAKTLPGSDCFASLRQRHRAVHAAGSHDARSLAAERERRLLAASWQRRKFLRRGSSVDLVPRL